DLVRLLELLDRLDVLAEVVQGGAALVVLARGGGFVGGGLGVGDGAGQEQGCNGGYNGPHRGFLPESRRARAKARVCPRPLSLVKHASQRSDGEPLTLEVRLEHVVVVVLL